MVRKGLKYNCKRKPKTKQKQNKIEHMALPSDPKEKTPF